MGVSGLPRGETMTDKRLDKLVRAFEKGDESAFDALYEATSTDVYYTILMVLKDPSLSEDIMQDTYMKMIESLPKYQAKGEFRAWIKTIAKRRALNVYNERKREGPSDADEGPLSLLSSEDASEKRFYLEELMRILDEEEKEIVIRHAVLGEKHKTIAKTINRPLGTVLWKYQNALKKLRREGGAPDEE